MEKVNYRNIKVKKPWGSEYLIYQNNTVAIWLLKIKKGQNTSLHCHPAKKTGLILLTGEATVELGFYNTKKLKAPAKLMIRPGLFHSTKALSKDGITLLELETPVDKEDLVRYKDEYGREEKPYEGKESMVNLKKNDIIFGEPENGRTLEYNFNSTKVTIEKHTNTESIINRSKDTIIAIIDGGMISKNGSFVLCPGDIIYPETIDKLAEVFSIKSYLSILTVKS